MKQEEPIKGQLKVGDIVHLFEVIEINILSDNVQVRRFVSQLITDIHLDVQLDLPLALAVLRGFFPYFFLAFS